MSNQVEHRIWEITTLTPLHVGDGEKMYKDMDFMRTKSGLEIIDIETVIERLRNNKKAISDIGNIAIDEIFSTYNLKIDPKYILTCQGQTPNDIKRFIKDAFDNIYLPGSSLKGAIRTALWMTLDYKHLPSVTNYDNFRKKVKLLGEKPHKDFLRPLQVSDSKGLQLTGTLEAKEVKIFNLRNGNKPIWINFKGDRRYPEEDYRKARGIYVESLKPKSKLYVKATLDSFLFSDTVSRLWKIPKGNGLDNFKQLTEIINNHSLKTAKLEKKFFSQFGSNTSMIVDFFDHSLGNFFAETEKCPESFILRLAWGGGWNDMTGKWIRDFDMPTIRYQENLGKNFCPKCKSQFRGNKKDKLGQYFCKRCKSKFFPNQLQLSDVFPKTRRLAVKGGVPSEPLGWIMVKPVQDESLFSQTVTIPIVSKPVPLSPEPVSESTAPPQEPESAPSPKPVEKEVVQEVWENAHVKWTSNNGMLTATNAEGNKKAEVKGKKLVPEQYHKKLIKQKKAVPLSVTVEPYGNAFTIVKIE